MSDPSREPIRINLTPRTVGIFLATIVVMLGMGYVATTLWHYFFSPENDFGLYRYFHLGQEGNLPTYISALYLLSAGFLLALITRHERQNGSKTAPYWMGLTVGFFLMSFDEATQIYEGVIGVGISPVFGGGEGIWHYGWYIPFIPIVLIIAFLYISFLRRLPSKYARLFVLAGVIFVGGSIGVEMMEAYIQSYQIEGGAMFLSMLIEESCEMLGVVLFIYALLSYIAEHRITCRLGARSTEKAPLPAAQK